MAHARHSRLFRLGRRTVSFALYRGIGRRFSLASTRYTNHRALTLWLGASLLTVSLTH